MANMPILWLIVASLSWSFLCSSATGFAKDRAEVIVAKHGAIATDDGRCSKIGRDVLCEGGHAVDAAVAAALCLGVVSPASSGIGGGAFMLVRLANGKEQAFDMRETAPLLAHEKMYGGNATKKASGALSIGVPGELAGLYIAWKQHGKLPWRRLVQPAKRLAGLGFKISPYLRFQMVTTESEIMANEGLREVFTSNGSLLEVGDVCQNKKLAITLREIANLGAEAFYNGSIGTNLVRDVKKLGGILSFKDLQSYQVKVKKPISTEFHGLRILTMPPPSGGPEVLLILNILARYKAPSGISGSLGVHREIEALKHAFAVRMNLGDPDFINITDVLSDMLSNKFSEELKESIYDNMTFDPDHYGGRWNQVKDHGTSHLCVVDKDRNAVSMTSTVNSYFGSMILSPSTGIVLNNEMDDFSVPGNASAGHPPPSPANFIRPRKRPLSSMAPSIVLKNRHLKAVIGASGGVNIIAGTTEVLLNYFGQRMDPFSAVIAPRVYHQLIPNVVHYENWTTVSGDHFEVPAETREALRKKGHVLQSLPGGTICQFIVQDLEHLEHNNNGGGELVAVSDPRKGGIPSGF